MVPSLTTKVYSFPIVKVIAFQKVTVKKTDIFRLIGAVDCDATKKL